VLAGALVVGAEEVRDEGLAAVLAEVTWHAEVAEEEVEAGAVRVGGESGASVAASPAPAARELDAAAAARQVPHRALHESKKLLFADGLKRRWEII
jgi:hypothetical protein